MGGNRRGPGASEAPRSQGTTRLPTRLARGSPAHRSHADPSGSRSRGSVATTSPRLLQSADAAGRRNGAGFASSPSPTHLERRAGGRTPIGGRDLGTGASGHAGRRLPDHGAISWTRPTRCATALQTPEDGAGPSRRDTRTIDLRHLRVHTGLPKHGQAERRLALDVARPPRHGGPRSGGTGRRRTE